MHIILEQEDTTKPYYKVGLSNEQQWLDDFAAFDIAPLGWEDTPDKRLDCAYVIQDPSSNDEGFLYEVYCRFHGIPLDVLQTTRCYVRELCLDDMDSLYELYSSEGFTEFMEPLFDYEEELEYEKKYIRNIYGIYGFGMWLVFDKATERLIGRCGLEYKEQENGEAAVELGYGIHADFRKKGYATEVCSAIMKYAKDRNLLPILCRIDPQNAASVALARKLGFIAADEIINNEQYWWYKA